MLKVESDGTVEIGITNISQAIKDNDGYCNEAFSNIQEHLDQSCSPKSFHLDITLIEIVQTD